MQKSPLDLKNEGNALFQKCQFTKTLSCYSAGIDAMTQDVNDDNNLKATLYSNRSGCYYEMGDYGEVSLLQYHICVQSQSCYYNSHYRMYFYITTVFKKMPLQMQKRACKSSTPIQILHSF